MTPHDQQQFRDLIKNFVDDCGVSPPFHLVIVGANGAVSVQRHTDSTIEQVCSTVESSFVAPITVTIISQDGAGKSAKITVEAATPILQ